MSNNLKLSFLLSHKIINRREFGKKHFLIRMNISDMPKKIIPIVSQKELKEIFTNFDAHCCPETDGRIIVDSIGSSIYYKIDEMYFRVHTDENFTIILGERNKEDFDDEEENRKIAESIYKEYSAHQH